MRLGPARRGGQMIYMAAIYFYYNENVYDS